MKNSNDTIGLIVHNYVYANYLFYIQMPLWLCGGSVECMYICMYVYIYIYIYVCIVTGEILTT
jgi:hypothetical protein